MDGEVSIIIIRKREILILGLSYVSSGMIDLYFNHQLSAWDQVAGILLVNEAGGCVVDRSNGIKSLRVEGKELLKKESKK